MVGCSQLNDTSSSATLLPGLGPLFFGILMGSGRFWACWRATLWAQLAGSRPLGLPGPTTGLPGPAMDPSNQPALLAQPICGRGGGGGGRERKRERERKK